MSREDAKGGPTGGPKGGGLERRAFLKGVGVAGAGAAAAAVAGGAAEAAESNEEQAKQRYGETDHVKRFYALSRL